MTAHLRPSAPDLGPDPSPATPARERAPAASGDDEPALVRRAQRGEHAAFEQLYRRHVGRVYALCARLTGDRQRAAERTQDVFVRAWEALPAFRAEAELAHWLRRIAINAELTSARSERRRPTETMSDAAEPPARGQRDVAAGIDLERAIAALPAGARTAFVLHDVEGFTHEEIAQRTGLAAGTIRAQLHRARRLLMEALDR